MFIVFDRVLSAFWSDFGPILGPNFDQKSIKNDDQKKMRKNEPQELQHKPVLAMNGKCVHILKLSNLSQRNSLSLFEIYGLL